MVKVLAERYELRALLGTGSMARVVEAHDRTLRRSVAIKFLRADAADAEGRARFVREACAAASFVHPHAVTVYDVGEIGSHPYLVMELVRGPSLADVVHRRGPLPVDVATSIADQVLDALGAAHAKGWVHRDVKPANVLLADVGTVKLADFGLAKALHDASEALTRPGQVLGTPMYLAPEQSTGRGASPASDLYAVGVVLFEMLTGALPFSGRSLAELAAAHRSGPVPGLRRPEVPASVVGVLETALAKEPEQRYPDASAMRTALRAARARATQRSLVAPSTARPPAKVTERAGQSIKEDRMRAVSLRPGESRWPRSPRT